MLLDRICYFFLGSIRAREDGIRCENHVRDLGREFRNVLYVHDARNICSAVADDHPHPRLILQWQRLDLFLLLLGAGKVLQCLRNRAASLRNALRDVLGPGGRARKEDAFPRGL
jgi:hypothetical protein